MLIFFCFDRADFERAIVATYRKKSRTLLLRTQAANVHRRQDWHTILQLLVYSSLLKEYQPKINELAICKLIGLVKSNEPINPNSDQVRLRISVSENLVHEVDPSSLTTSIGALELLIKEAVNVSPMNFPLLVDCLVIYNNVMRHGRVKVMDIRNYGNEPDNRPIQNEMTFDHLTESLRLVELMALLHQKAAPLYKSTNAKYAVELEDGEKLEDRLWSECWEPLLKGISRACCDARKQLRAHALTQFQKTLHMIDMQNISYKHWVRCFENILFPLVQTLINPDWTVTPSNAPPGSPKVPPSSNELEETRIRAMNNILTKVFLQHLNYLCQDEDSFKRIWLQILDFMDRYINIGRGETLAEAITESLKNVLLVMDTQKVFSKKGVNWVGFLEVKVCLK